MISRTPMVQVDQFYMPLNNNDIDYSTHIPLPTQCTHLLHIRRNANQYCHLVNPNHTTSTKCAKTTTENSKQLLLPSRVHKRLFVLNTSWYQTNVEYLAYFKLTRNELPYYNMMCCMPKTTVACSDHLIFDDWSNCPSGPVAPISPIFSTII